MVEPTTHERCVGEMGRRRKLKPRLSPVWMPWLRDKMADWLDSRTDLVYKRPSSDYEDVLQEA